MSTLTVPRAFTRSEFGWPLYGARGVDGAEVLFSIPFLPERLTARWESAVEAGPGCEPLTAGTWAQLLFLAEVDPEHTLVADAIAAADRVLVDHRCDLTECAAECAAELADHPQACPRWDRCVLLAARLYGAEA